MTVIGIADGIAVRLGDGEETAGIVVLVLCHTLCSGDGGQQTNLVIGVLLGLLPGIVHSQDVACAVVGVAGDVALCVSDRLQPALGGVGISNGIAEGVGLAGQVACFVVGILRDMTEGVGDLRQVVRCVIGIAGGVAQSVGVYAQNVSKRFYPHSTLILLQIPDD